jgi:ribosomal protein L12E/L44/L45/RPP1/RPP2
MSFNNRSDALIELLEERGVDVDEERVQEIVELLQEGRV